MTTDAERSGISDTNVPSVRRDLLWLTPLLLLFFFALLGSRPLSNPDEGRYTEIPRYMAQTGEYVTPRLNGVKYFEKPPLQYWLSALTFEVFGVNEWTSRAWIAILAAGGAVATYLGGRHLFGRTTGLIAAFLLSTTLLYYALSRIVILDMAVAVFISTAMLSFVCALEFPPGVRRRWLWYGFYASMALAVLSKGLIGFVLPGAVAFFWVLIFNQWSRLRPFHPGTGAALLLAIAAPWHVLAADRNHDFAQFYFVHEHFQRFFSKIHDRYQAPWFFVPVLLGGLLPWVVFAPAALRKRYFGAWSERRHNAATWFLVVWIAVIFGFFSYSQSKLIPYILPVFPACALILARPLASAWEGDRVRGVLSGFLAFAGFCLVLAIAVVLYPLPADKAFMAPALAPFRILLPVILLVAAWLIVRRQLRANVRGAITGSLTCFAIFLVCLNPLGTVLDTRSSKSLMLELKKSLKPDDAVYSVADYAQDMPVYLDRLVDVVDYEGELEFGIHAEPERSRNRFISREEFLRRWAQPQRAFALIRTDEHVEWFTQLPGVSSHVIARTSRFVLMTNQIPFRP